ncbi:MAG: hypothetical protein MJ224_07610 [archaeon]|nr:hypothetical protein [archaeon]
MLIKEVLPFSRTLVKFEFIWELIFMIYVPVIKLIVKMDPISKIISTLVCAFMS